MAAKKKSKKKAKKAKAVKAKKKTAGARKVVKAKKSKAKKAKKAARPAKAKKAAKKTVKAKKPAKKKRARRSNALEGEGSYTAARNYDEEQREFVAENKGKIGKMAKDAEAALDGPEGDDLREAEAEGRSHARD
ncbi:MAG TPA: hypothetical protein VMF58_17050 [Rhizomicrobium sp.]|nr:hypothetical protein [Rhizomicrobium sp.]